MENNELLKSDYKAKYESAKQNADHAQSQYQECYLSKDPEKRQMSAYWANEYNDYMNEYWEYKRKYDKL